jgi:hypothetical protein
MAELLDHLVGKSIKLAGMKAGKEQFANEHHESHLPSWLKNDPFNNKNPAPDRDFDIEPER